MWESSAVLLLLLLMQGDLEQVLLPLKVKIYSSAS